MRNLANTMTTWFLIIDVIIVRDVIVGLPSEQPVQRAFVYRLFICTSACTPCRFAIIIPRYVTLVIYLHILLDNVLDCMYIAEFDSCRCVSIIPPDTFSRSRMHPACLVSYTAKRRRKCTITFLLVTLPNIHRF